MDSARSTGVEPEAEIRAQSRFARFRAALAARDWLDIAIELVVVTVGVLLAFEIQQWGQERGRQRDERELLERLYRETAVGTKELSGLITTHERAVRELGAVLRAKDDQSKLAAYAHQEGFGCVIGTLPSAGFNDTASQELVSSGRISMITDPQVRDSVRDLAAEQEMGTQQLVYGRENIETLLPWFLPYYRTQLREGEVYTRCTMDWPDLVKHQDAVTALGRAYRVHQLLLGIRKRTLKSTLRVRGQLACKLDKPECRK